MAYSPSVKEFEPAQARAAAYALIAHGFQYPDEETLSALSEPMRWEHWPGVLERTDRPTKESLAFVRDAVKAFANGSDDTRRELQERYDGLFGHAVRGACPAYEMEYGRNEIIRQASDLADLAGFYRAFGMEIAGPVANVRSGSEYAPANGFFSDTFYGNPGITIAGGSNEIQRNIIAVQGLGLPRG